MDVDMLSPALRRVLPLLKNPAEATLLDGYLDLLSMQEVRSTGRAQSFWLTDAGATVYDRLLHPVGRVIAPATRHVSGRLGLEWGAAVLDLGCGPGNITAAMARSVGGEGLVIGLDASPTMLARAVARNRAENTGYLHADAEHVPLHDATVDAVSCALLLHLVHDVGGVLDQVARVLRPGGRVAISVTTAGYRFARYLSPHAGRAVNARMFEPDDIPRMLADRGFGAIRSSTAGLLQCVDADLATNTRTAA